MMSPGARRSRGLGIPWQTTALRLVHTAPGNPRNPSWLGRPPRRLVSARTQASMAAVETPGAIRAAIVASVAAAARPARRIAATSAVPRMSMPMTRLCPPTLAAIQYLFDLGSEAEAQLQRVAVAGEVLGLDGRRRVGRHCGVVDAPPGGAQPPDRRGDVHRTDSVEVDADVHAAAVDPGRRRRSGDRHRRARDRDRLIDAAAEQAAEEAAFD